MIARLRNIVVRRWRWLALVLLLGGYWLLPIGGRVALLPAGDTEPGWPQLRAARSSGGESPLRVWVTDVVPWTHVALTVDGRTARLVEAREIPGGQWTWEWAAERPSDVDVHVATDAARTIVFYRDCATGCRERGRLSLSGGVPTTVPTPRRPTKLGVVFANPDRDWHGRAGWVVDLSYARGSDDPRWSVDRVAERVHDATAKGLRVLLRVDHAPGQSIPPADDAAALETYLAHVRRLARDDRLRAVHGLIIGSGYNTPSSGAPDASPTDPTWYARLLGGHGTPANATDNVVATVRAERPSLAVLVGPIQPWQTGGTAELEMAPGADGPEALVEPTTTTGPDRPGRPGGPDGTDRRRAPAEPDTAGGPGGGSEPGTADDPNTLNGRNAPWLAYFDALLAALDAAARTRAAAGVPSAAPDGFALQAPGRPAVAEAAGVPPSDEPRHDLPHPDWPAAQAGFRVYQDWLAIINAYPSTRGAPAYISSTNTFDPVTGTPPAESYPAGWLTAALDVVQGEPQVAALCWFMDLIPDDEQWNAFSLTRGQGRLEQAAADFDALLARPVDTGTEEADR